MEIDFSPVWCGQETVPFLDQESADAPCRSRLMCFHIASMAAGVVLQAAASYLESIRNRQVEVPMGGSYLKMLLHLRNGCLPDLFAQARLVLDDQFLAGQGQINANVVQPAAPVMAMWDLHGHMTAYDSAVEGLP